MLDMCEKEAARLGCNAEDKLRFVRILMSSWGIKGDVVLGWRNSVADIAEQKVINLVRELGLTNNSSQILPKKSLPSTSSRNDGTTPNRAVGRRERRSLAKGKSRKPRTAQRRKAASTQKQKQPQFVNSGIAQEYKRLQLATEQAKLSLREAKLVGDAELVTLRVTQQAESLRAQRAFRDNKENLKSTPQPVSSSDGCASREAQSDNDATTSKGLRKSGSKPLAKKGKRTGEDRERTSQSTEQGMEQ